METRISLQDALDRAARRERKAKRWKAANKRLALTLLSMDWKRFDGKAVRVNGHGEPHNG